MLSCSVDLCYSIDDVSSTTERSSESEDQCNFKYGLEQQLVVKLSSGIRYAIIAAVCRTCHHARELVPDKVALTHQSGYGASLLDVLHLGRCTRAMHGFMPSESSNIYSANAAMQSCLVACWFSA